MNRFGVGVIGVCMILAAARFGRADVPDIAAPAGASSAESVFQSRGVTQQGFWLILPNEADVHDGVWALKQADEGLRVETTGRRNIKFAIDGGLHTLDGLEDQYEATNNQYTQSVDVGKSIDHSNTDLYNRWVEQNNEILGRRDVLRDKIDKQARAIEDLRTREEQVEDSRGRYISLVMDTGTKAESVAAAYAALTNDAGLAKAILQVNQNPDSRLKLGPSSAFIDDLKFIRKCVKDIVTGSVPVKRTDGALHVQAVLNGKFTATMIWDTGASAVSLSYATGEALGLKPTDKDPTLEMTIADGSKVKAKLMVLDSIRLGAFTLKNVDCVLWPKTSDKGADDLLGDTFQSHFLSRLDQRTGQLQLTPIDSSITSGPVAGPLSKSQDNPNQANPDLARRATVVASSTQDGYYPTGAIDGVVNGSPNSPQNEWVCGDQTGSITLNWADPVIVSSVKLWDRVDKVDHILSGQLVFDDGTVVPFGELPRDGSPLTARFRPKYVRSMQVVILTVSPGTNRPGFAEIAAFR